MLLILPSVATAQVSVSPWNVTVTGVGSTQTSNSWGASSNAAWSSPYQRAYSAHCDGQYAFAATAGTIKYTFSWNGSGPSPEKVWVRKTSYAGYSCGTPVGSGSCSNGLGDPVIAAEGDDGEPQGYSTGIRYVRKLVKNGTFVIEFPVSATCLSNFGPSDVNVSTTAEVVPIGLDVHRADGGAEVDVSDGVVQGDTLFSYPLWHELIDWTWWDDVAHPNIRPNVANLVGPWPDPNNIITGVTMSATGPTNSVTFGPMQHSGELSFSDTEPWSGGYRPGMDKVSEWVFKAASMAISEQMTYRWKLHDVVEDVSWSTTKPKLIREIMVGVGYLYAGGKLATTHAATSSYTIGDETSFSVGFTQGLQWTEPITKLTVAKLEVKEEWGRKKIHQRTTGEIITQISEMPQNEENPVGYYGLWDQFIGIEKKGTGTCWTSVGFPFAGQPLFLPARQIFVTPKWKFLSKELAP